jgi:hypothetical protein
MIAKKTAGLLTSPSAPTIKLERDNKNYATNERINESRTIEAQKFKGETAGEEKSNSDNSFFCGSLLHLIG